MIKVNNVVKTFDGFRALDGLTMEVEKGSIYGLVGPNGAGKSTILRHITGIYRPDSGTITVDGAPVYENPAVKSRVAFIPDDLYYFLSASTRDMMKFYRGLYPAFDDKRYQVLKEAFPAVDEKQPIRRLSKGMQKQSAFWLALCCNPDLLVLDEPVDGLDPVMRRQVWSLLMGDVAQRGTTVLVSSHNLRELEDVCDHVGILSRGKVLLQRSLTDLQDNVVKMQIVFQEPEMPKLPEDLDLLHVTQVGRIHTLIVRGSSDVIKSRLAAFQPILYRFKSEVIEDEIYLLQCFRYILQNPVKAGICTKASLYTWSSYCNYFSSYSSFIYTEFLNTFFKKEKDFENYISIVDEGQYMDIDQLKKWNNQEIKDICNQKLGNKGIMELSQEDRILLIQELRQKTHASIRQLSEVTGISRYNVRYWKK